VNARLNPPIDIVADIVADTVGPGQRREPPNRIAAAVAISLAIHAVLLFAYRHSAPPPVPVASKASPPLTVRLRAPEPVVIPTPSTATAEARPARPEKSGESKATRQKSPAPADVIAMPENAPDTSAPTPTFTVEPPAGATPRFDPDAARRTAREIASEPDPARAGTAVGQIAPKPLASETRAARAIASAARRNCKDGVPGGLLAPLILMMDKKDSGCKW
jgi:hypothetical protein